MQRINALSDARLASKISRETSLFLPTFYRSEPFFPLPFSSVFRSVFISTLVDFRRTCRKPRASFIHLGTTSPLESFFETVLTLFTELFRQRKIYANAASRVGQRIFHSFDALISKRRIVEFKIRIVYVQNNHSCVSWNMRESLSKAFSITFDDGEESFFN